MNPFDGIKPSLGPFASVLSNPVGILISLVWAGAFIWAAVTLVINIAGFARARRQGRSHAADDATGGIVMCALTIILLGAVPVVFGIFSRMAG